MRFYTLWVVVSWNEPPCILTYNNCFSVFVFITNFLSFRFYCMLRYVGRWRKKPLKASINLQTSIYIHTHTSIHWSIYHSQQHKVIFVLFNFLSYAVFIVNKLYLSCVQLLDGFSLHTYVCMCIYICKFIQYTQLLQLLHDSRNEIARLIVWLLLGNDFVFCHKHIVCYIEACVDIYVRTTV